MVETVDAIAEGNIQAIPQSDLIEENEIKHAPKIFKEDCKIDWTKDTETVQKFDSWFIAISSCMDKSGS